MKMKKVTPKIRALLVVAVTILALFFIRAAVAKIYLQNNLNGNSMYMAKWNTHAPVPGTEEEDGSGTPVAMVSAPTTGYVLEPVYVDASASQNCSLKPQADGSPSVIVNYGDGFSANILESAHSYQATGPYTITVTCKNLLGATHTTSTSITISDIPSPPCPGPNCQMHTTAGADATVNGNWLHAAINAAKNANTTEQRIVLAANRQYQREGGFILPSTAGSKYITIESGNISSLPAADRRVSPGDATNMPSILNQWDGYHENGQAMRTSRVDEFDPLRQGLPTPKYYRLRGLRFGKSLDTNLTDILLVLGDGGYLQQRTSNSIAHHFIVDQCLFDGGGINSITKRAIFINSNYTVVANSYIYGIKAPPCCEPGTAESTGIQAIALEKALTVWNTHFEVAGVGSLVGGGGQFVRFAANVSSPTSTSATLSHTTQMRIGQHISFRVGGVRNNQTGTVVRSISGNNITFDPLAAPPDAGTSLAKWGETPSGLEFRRNRFTKDLAWRTQEPNPPNRWLIKALWELKHARNVVLDGNLLENHWPGEGYFPIGISTHPQLEDQPYTHIDNVQVSNNKVRNADGGINMKAWADQFYGEGPGDGGVWTNAGATNWIIRNNLLYNIGYQYAGVYGRLLQSTALKLKYLTLDHNTIVGDPNSAGGHTWEFAEASAGHVQGTLFVTNNVLMKAVLGISSPVVSGGTAVLNAHSPDYRFIRNMIVNLPDGEHPNYPNTPPNSPNFYTADFASQFDDNYVLSPSSLGRGQALDGTDIGANIAQVQAATVGAITGVWTN